MPDTGDCDTGAITDIDGDGVVVLDELTLLLPLPAGVPLADAPRDFDAVPDPDSDGDTELGTRLGDGVLLVLALALTATGDFEAVTLALALVPGVTAVPFTITNWSMTSPFSVRNVDVSLFPSTSTNSEPPIICPRFPLLASSTLAGWLKPKSDDPPVFPELPAQTLT